MPVGIPPERRSATERNAGRHGPGYAFVDFFKQAGTPEAVIAEMVGHSNEKSMTMGRYGKRYQPKVLLDALVLLDYGIGLPVWQR